MKDNRNTLKKIPFKLKLRTPRFKEFFWDDKTQMGPVGISNHKFQITNYNNQIFNFEFSILKQFLIFNFKL